MCLTICSNEAIRTSGDGAILIERSRCDACGLCVDNCPAKALHVFGARMTVEDVLSNVEEDLQFYTRSDGGVTLSGGEPLLQPEFSEALLRACRERGIHTAIDTTGFADWERLEKVLRHVNTAFYDIKCWDSDLHYRWTGHDNLLIMENLERLCSSFPDISVIVRTPIIPTVNDTDEEIKNIASKLMGVNGIQKWELIKYHRFGESKYKQLGREYELNNLTFDDARFDYLKTIALSILENKIALV